MLTEEAHHMFVGETGIDRVVTRTCELIKQAPGEDVRALGGIDLPTLQKYINLWYSLSADLFGGEISSNAADFFAAGVKGRYKEGQFQDHLALEGSYPIPVFEGGRLVEKQAPLRNAMNEVLRDCYVEDCQRAVDKWNRILERAGIADRLRLPSRRCHRQQGIYAGLHFDVDGSLMSAAEWEKRKDAWLPSAADAAYIGSLMQPVPERGKMAGWIAPPARGINGQPLDYEYVRM